jgi:hypothetical protein
MIGGTWNDSGAFLYASAITAAPATLLETSRHQRYHRSGSRRTKQRQLGEILHREIHHRTGPQYVAPHDTAFPLRPSFARIAPKTGRAYRPGSA